MKLISLAGAVVLLGSLSACAGNITSDARSDMEESKEAYKHCLEKNAASPDACEAQKRAYDVDVESYKIDIDSFRANSAAGGN